MNFYKYDGLGNDYLVYDCQKNTRVITSEMTQKICDRNYGLGSDGILIGPIYKDGMISVRIINPDGSEAEKSGNGVRIFAKYLKDAGYVLEHEFTMNTLGGNVHVRYNNDEGTNITVSMGKLDFSRKAIGAVGVPNEVVDTELEFNQHCYQCTCVSIGNPHCVIPMETISKEKVCEIGQYSEIADYFPNRINTQIVKVIDRHHIQIEIFERGAGYTLASGSSSCAAAGAVYRLGLVDSPVHVHMPGGTLYIEIDSMYNVKMIGNVEYIGKMSIYEPFVC
jgi:diaminopimelate epimerase